MKKFPDDFVWGTATAAHQIEGNNTNSDWFRWETTKKPGQKYPLEPSGLACNSYELYKKDIDLAADLNNNAIRFSIEWARIQPDENTFDDKEIEHYRNVLKYCKEKHLKTYVTLHHFTSPIWFADKNGWVSSQSSEYFAKYVKVAAEKLGDLIDYFITINEPQVYANMGYFAGLWFPGKFNPLQRMIVMKNFTKSHIAAYKAIKSVNQAYQVGIVDSFAWFEGHNFIDKIIAKIAYWYHVDLFLNPLLKANSLDFFGLNHYRTFFIKTFVMSENKDFLSDMDWGIYGLGLGKILVDLKKYKFPIFITENGGAFKDEAKRIRLIDDMLKGAYDAIQKGANVKGYFHWSLLDNFEWHEGYWPKFGLIAVDRKTFKRTPKKSYYHYQKICKNNAI